LPKEIYLLETTHTLNNGKIAYQILVLDRCGSRASVEFMWECKQNCVDILYLPAHSIYVLQPLNLGTFLLLKSCYSKGIDGFKYLGDVVFVKK
jgi:hypothetical protein